MVQRQASEDQHPHTQRACGGLLLYVCKFTERNKKQSNSLDVFSCFASEADSDRTRSGCKLQNVDASTGQHSGSNYIFNVDTQS